VLGAVVPIDLEVGVLAAPDLIGEERITPGDRSVDRAGIGIEEQLRGVEPVPARGLPRSVHTISIARPRPRVRQIDVPDVVGVLHNRYTGLLPVVVEEAKLHAGRVLGEQGEVDARAVPDRAKRIRSTGPVPDAGGSLF